MILQLMAGAHATNAWSNRFFVQTILHRRRHLCFSHFAQVFIHIWRWIYWLIENVLLTWIRKGFPPPAPWCLAGQSGMCLPWGTIAWACFCFLRVFVFVFVFVYNPLMPCWTVWHVPAKGHNRQGMPGEGQAWRHLTLSITKYLWMPHAPADIRTRWITQIWLIQPNLQKLSTI